jgi:hypothetical protein
MRSDGVRDRIVRIVVWVRYPPKLKSLGDRIRDHLKLFKDSNGKNPDLPT